MDELTKEQKYTIAKFYKLYMERSNEGQTEKEANDFKDSITTQDDYFCDRNYDDFVENLKVLIKHGYIDGHIEDNQINDIKMTTKAFTDIEKVLANTISTKSSQLMYDLFVMNFLYGRYIKRGRMEN